MEGSEKKEEIIRGSQKVNSPTTLTALMEQLRRVQQLEAEIKRKIAQEIKRINGRL